MSGGSQKYNMKTVMMNDQQSEEGSYTVTNLRKFTEYEVFLMPFYRNIEGQPSNSLHVQTLEDSPSAPPSNIRTEMLNFTSAELLWSPPPPQHRNGVLLGYQIHIKGNGSYFHSNLTLNATTTHFILTNLTLNEEYTVRACAFTSAGLGPFSSPTSFQMDPTLVKYPIVSHPDNGDIITEPWFVALLGSIVFVLILIFIGVILYRKHYSLVHKSSAKTAQHYEDITR